MPAHFTPIQFWFLIPSLMLILLSVIFHQNNKRKTSLILLLSGALGLRMFIALLDPFLNDWDERFHALVAKNMMENPFNPMLYANPVLPYDYKDWSGNHIWVHKQPLFLWQIALFFKLFGVNEFVLRLPSVLMTSLLVFLIYRIGKITLSENIGYCAAFLFAVAYYHLEVMSGVIPCEHNDIANLFYVTASIWAWTEYSHSNKKYWLILIGLFVGMAVLVKWLPGLIVFAGWGMTILLHPEKRKQIKYYKEIAISFFVAVIVFLPWQIYIYHAFPVESVYESEYNYLHLFKAIEGHSGSIWYYIENLPWHYGIIIAYLIPLGLFFLYQSLKSKEYIIAYFTCLLVIYLFFSGVQTKMPSYVLTASPIIYLSLGTLFAKWIEHLQTTFKNKFLQHIVSIIAFLLIGIINLNLGKIESNHTDKSEYNEYYGISGYRKAKLNNTTVFKELEKAVPSKDYIIGNCKSFQDIEIMFYTDFVAYDWMSEENYQFLKTKGYKIAVFDNPDLQYYLRNDNDVFKIKLPLL